MSAYYLRAVAPGWKLGDIDRGMAQLLVLQLVGLALRIIVPGVALWFPNGLFGR